MDPLTIMLGLLGFFGGQTGLKALDAYLFNPQEIGAQEEVSEKAFAREMKGLTMMSQQQMANQAKMWSKAESMQEKQHGWEQEAGLMSMLGQMAMGSQAAGAAEGQAFMGGAMQPEQQMLPGMGLVDALR